MNIRGFWIYQACQCWGSGYTTVLNIPRLHRVLNMPQYVLIIPGYVWLCLTSAIQSACFRYEVGKSWYWCCTMGKHSKVSSSTKWRLGENVVLGLMECLTPTFSFDIFIDNYFIYFCLLNQNMGFVNRMDQNVAKYCVFCFFLVEGYLLPLIFKMI